MAGNKKSLLESHPEATNSGEEFFNFEKNPIVEETVNRGDKRQYTPTAYEITDKDLEDLAKEALQYIEVDLLEDNRPAAISSAVSMAVGSMGEGRWQGKVSANTLRLIDELVDKKLTGKEEEDIHKRVDQNKLYTNKSVETDVTPKQASKGVVVKLDKGRPQKQSPGAANKTLSKMPSRDRGAVKKMLQKGDTVVLSSLINRMDKLAGAIQVSDLKLAEQMDSITNTVEKGAVSLEELSEYKKENSSFIEKKFPWLAAALNGRDPAVSSTFDFLRRVQDEFLANHDVQRAVQSLGGLTKENDPSGVGLQGSPRYTFEEVSHKIKEVLSAESRMKEALKALSEFKDMPGPQA